MSNLPIPQGLQADIGSIQHVAESDIATGHLDHDFTFSDHSAPDCYEELSITNIGSQSLNIDKLRFTYNSNSTKNDFAYHLVDYCSLINCPPCEGCGASIAGCLFASVQLQSGAEGFSIDAPVTNDQCSQTLAPGDTQPLAITINSTDPQQIYHISQSLLVSTAQGSLELKFPSNFDSNLAFASFSQFTCYKYTNTSFIQEAQPIQESCA